MSYIRYITKNNGQEYASLADTSRNGKQVNQQYISNLGKVVDKANGIFKSRERGLFRYTLEEGFTDLPDTYIPARDIIESERLILDFGDSFFLDKYLNAQSFAPAFRSALPAQSDTLFALLFYRILADKKACCYADAWYHGNYASILFPKAKLQSQRISEFLAEIGEEWVQRAFFNQYYQCLYGKGSTTGILIDSSGLPNASKMSITQISNHNGDISLEARLIYVLDRKTGMPIYFRYCSGNVIDVSTLCTTLAELGEQGIYVDYAIVDAGYFSEGNVKELYKHQVKFIVRLAPNRKLFKEVAEERLPGLKTPEHAIRYGNRLLFIEKVAVDIYGNDGYAYIGVDMDSYNQQMKRATFDALDDKLSPEEMNRKVSRLGLFMIVASENIPVEEVLPLYYTRQQIEQVFDVGKNDADLLPIRVQSEKTFRGHLMLTFLATIVLQKLQRDIIQKRKKKDKMNPEGALIVLRNQKCKVYKNAIVPQEAVKCINDIYRLLGIECPTKIEKGAALQGKTPSL